MRRILELTWDDKLITTFWNGITDTPMDRVSFGKAAGKALLDLVRKYLPDRGTILDFGSGSGDLLAILMSQGFQCAAYDTSKDRNKALNEVADGNASFLGHINEGDGRLFDVVFCTEVIEHVKPRELESFSKKLASRVAPGGLLILTTPNEERLEDNLCFCPKCEHTFHRWQHLNSFDSSTIKTLFSANAINEVATFFTDYSGNALALSAWRELNAVVAKGTPTAGFAASARQRIKNIRLFFANRLKVAKTATRIVLGKDYPTPEPGHVYGNGSCLVFIGRKMH